MPQILMRALIFLHREYTNSLQHLGVVEVFLQLAFRNRAENGELHPTVFSFPSVREMLYGLLASNLRD